MTGKPSWRHRRRTIFSTLTFLGATIATCLAAIVCETGPADHLTDIVWGCLIFGSSIIGSYVFGAVWDDKNFMNRGH